MNVTGRTSWLRALSLLAALLVLEPARADEAAERERIARERSEATARHERQRRECEQRFAVTACVDEARAEHRQTMMGLRRQEALLDEAQRKQRAAERLAAIEQKTRQERGAASSPMQGRASAAEPRRPRVPAMAASRPASTAAVAAAASTPDRREAESRSRARFDARQREAAARREAAEQRRIEREKSGKPPAAPLPDPATR